MKQRIFYLPILSLLFMAACSKPAPLPSASASVTFVNAMSGTPMIVFSKYATNATNYNNSWKYSAGSDPVPVEIIEMDEATYQPKGDPLLRFSLDCASGNIYSLFVAGTLQHPDTLFVRDHPIPLSLKDSAIGIRFLNLSPGSQPISINLQGNAAGSEGGNLSYKSITSFKKYAADATIAGYIFEFRNAITDELLATCTIDNINSKGEDNAPNPWRNKNITIVFDGLPADPDWPQTTFIVKNY